MKPSPPISNLAVQLPLESPGGGNTLKAIASSPTANPYSKNYLEMFGLSLGGTQKALRVLLERDLIEKGENGYTLTDPVMKEWLCQSP